MILFLTLSSGCASGPSVARSGDVLTDLSHENERLEAQVTALREQLLLSEKKKGCTLAPSAQAKKLANSEALEPEARPADLEVVKLAPKPEDLPLEEQPEPDFSAPVRAFPPDERAGESQVTRPVLKVRGEHEAWVYHRPLDKKERKQAALGVATSDPSAKKSNP